MDISGSLLQGKQQSSSFTTSPFEKNESKSNKFLSQRMSDYAIENGIKALLNQIEKELVSSSLKLMGGKVNKVCDKLALSKSLFYRIVKQLNEPV